MPPKSVLGWAKDDDMRFGKIAILHQKPCQFTSSKREAWAVGGCPLRGGEASLRSNLMKHFRHQATGWSNGVVPTFLHFGQRQRTGISSAPARRGGLPTVAPAPRHGRRLGTRLPMPWCSG